MDGNSGSNGDGNQAQPLGPDLETRTDVATLDMGAEAFDKTAFLEADQVVEANSPSYSYNAGSIKKAQDKSDEATRAAKARTVSSNKTIQDLYMLKDRLLNKKGRDIVGDSRKSLEESLGKIEDVLRDINGSIDRAERLYTSRLESFAKLSEQYTAYDTAIAGYELQKLEIEGIISAKRGNQDLSSLQLRICTPSYPSMSFSELNSNLNRVSSKMRAAKIDRNRIITGINILGSELKQIESTKLTFQSIYDRQLAQQVETLERITSMLGSESYDQIIEVQKVIAQNTERIERVYSRTIVVAEAYLTSLEPVIDMAIGPRAMRYGDASGANRIRDSIDGKFARLADLSSKSNDQLAVKAQAYINEYMH